MRNRDAKKVLKAYGKELFDSRVAYTEKYTEEETVKVSRNVNGYIFKKWAMRSVSVVLILFVCVISADALGIKLFNFSKDVNDDHDQYVSEQELSNGDGEIEFHQFTYIPDGYVLNRESERMVGIKEYFYNGPNGEDTLVIKESLAVNNTISIDNERCESKVVIIGEMETVVYDFFEEDAPDIYMIQDGDMVIIISTDAGLDEVKNIILGIK